MSDDMLGKSALAEIAGPLEDFFGKLGSSDGRSWLVAFKHFLRKEDPWPRFPTWKTITLGTGLNTCDDFEKALRDGGYGISGVVLGNFPSKVRRRKTEVDLVLLATSELTGKEEGGTTAEVLAGAKSFGLKKCTREVVFQLRLQYEDQPLYEWLLIGVDPVAGSYGYLDVFNLGRNDYGVWLSRGYVDPDSSHRGDSLWVFVHSK